MRIRSGRVLRAIAAIPRAVVAIVGVHELAFLVGLGLVAVGFWMAWRPGAFLVPGAVLLWIALPARESFIDHPPPPAKGRR
jgi:hypothetical protein